MVNGYSIAGLLLAGYVFTLVMRLWLWGFRELLRESGRWVGFLSFSP